MASPCKTIFAVVMTFAAHFKYFKPTWFYLSFFDSLLSLDGSNKEISFQKN